MLKVDKSFIREFVKIAIPMTMQHLVLSSLNLVDTIMVGRLGDASIAAVGIGNQMYFMVMLYLLGVSGGGVPYLQLSSTVSRTIKALKKSHRTRLNNWSYHIDTIYHWIVDFSKVGCRFVYKRYRGG